MTSPVLTIVRTASPATDLTTRVLDDRDEVDAIVPLWAQLAASDGQSALSQPSWALGCFDGEEVFGRGRLRVVTVWAGDQLVGVGPFAETHEHGLRVVRFLGLWKGQPNRLLLAPGYEDAASLIWATLRTPRTYLRLDSIDEELGLSSLLDAGGWAVRAKEPSLCTVIDTNFDAEQFLGTPARKKLRKILTGADRSSRADGIDMELRRAHRPDELADVIPIIGAIEQRALGDWRRAGLHGELADGRVPAPLAIAARQGRLIADVYLASGQPCAFLIAVIGDSSVTALLMGHDPVFRAYSPGHVSYLNLYRWAHDHGARPIDMSLGDQQYKHCWSKAGYNVVSAVAAPNRATLAVTRAAGIVMDHAKGGLARASGRGPATGGDE